MLDQPVASDPLRGPALPPRQPDWPEATKRWWWTWRRSAQAQTFSPTDWDSLLDTAVVHARHWSGDTTAAAELRLRVAKFGATPEDRIRLRMQLSTPDAQPAATGEPRSRYAHLRAVKSA